MNISAWPFSHLRFFALLLFLFGAIEFCAADARTEEQKARFAEVKRNIEKIKSELEKTKTNRDLLQEKLESNERAIQKLDKKTRKLQLELEEKQSKLNTLRKEQKSLRVAKNAQSEIVDDYINAAYRLGQYSQIRLLLNQQDPAEVSRMLKYYKAFSAERQEKIAEFVDTLRRLADIEPEIAYETNQLKLTYSNLKEQQSKLRESQSTRQETLKKLQQEVSTKEKRLAGLVADRKRLETLLAKVYDEINSQELNFALGEFSKLKGRLPRPATGKTLNAFGRKRSGSSLPWNGLEISAKAGSDIIAVHHGQVVFSDYLRGHGLLLIIDHGSGFMSLYAHAEQLYKELGEWVEAGERVASVGTSGGRKEAALYFELRHNGKPTDPSPWFKRA